MDELIFAIQEAANTIATPNCVDIMSMFLSLGAIFAATYVACSQNEIMKQQASIADKQNKIALFERRFEIVDVLICCKTSLHLLELASEDTDVLRLLFLAFSKPNQKFNYEEARHYLENCSTKLQHADYFFSEGISSFIIIISADLFFLANADPETDGPEEYHKKIQNYFEGVKNLDEYKIFAKIREEMTMI